MRASAAFGNYIKAADLGGKRVTVTIENVELGEIQGDKKLIVSFVGKDKKLTLNRTNADTITEILGTDETDDWAGHRIVLFPSKTTYQGKRVDCIRVDAAVSAASHPPARPAPPPPPPPVEEDEPGEFVASDDDVPF